MPQGSSSHESDGVMGLESSASCGQAPGRADREGGDGEQRGERVPFRTYRTRGVGGVRARARRPALARRAGRVRRAGRDGFRRGGQVRIRVDADRGDLKVGLVVVARATFRVMGQSEAIMRSADQSRRTQARKRCLSVQARDQEQVRRGRVIGEDAQHESVVSGQPVEFVTCPAQSPHAVIVKTMCC